MTELSAKSFDAPDETRNFDRGHMEVITLDGKTVGRATFEPGWRWSECVKPLAGTDSCEVHHFGYVVSGQMKVVMNDGTEGEVGPGELMDIAPGHDAWIIGDEPCVLIDFIGAVQYATN